MVYIVYAPPRMGSITGAAMKYVLKEVAIKSIKNAFDW
jgi:hypothetical protein